MEVVHLQLKLQFEAVELVAVAVILIILDAAVKSGCRGHRHAYKSENLVLEAVRCCHYCSWKRSKLELAFEFLCSFGYGSGIVCL